MKTDEKYRLLKETLSKYEKIAVAFSAGVDSTLLLYAAKEALGIGAVAVTAVSPFMPASEIAKAREFCKEQNIKLIEINADFVLDLVKHNPKDRCYICKKAIMQKMLEAAKKEGISVLAEGSNKDDMSDYRPGAKAIEELGVISPLKAVGFSKSEIRATAKQTGLFCHAKPAYACLATRFMTGETLTRENLKKVETAEDYLHKIGFAACRVRCHGDMARIETETEDFDKLLNKSIREDIYENLKKIGFEFVSLDLGGYKKGNMNG